MAGQQQPDALGAIPDLRQHVAQATIQLDESEEGRRYGEISAGLRCAGCGERITKGLEFVKVEVAKDVISGERGSMRKTFIACVRPDCDYALECGREATAVRKINHEWLFLDDPKVRAMFAPEQPEEEVTPDAS